MYIFKQTLKLSIISKNLQSLSEAKILVNKIIRVSRIINHKSQYNLSLKYA